MNLSIINLLEEINECVDDLISKQTHERKGNRSTKLS